MDSLRKTAGALVLSICMMLIAISSTRANPVYTPGVWKNLSPAGGTDWVNDVQYAKTNPSLLYACLTKGNLIRSTNGGETWTPVGVGVFTYSGPQRVRIDPDNENNLYVIQGVGGNRGFYVSHDGGATWIQPQAFLDAVQTAGGGYTGDLYYISVDPTDYKHFLLSFHYSWASGTSGVLESTDGGNTFIIHYPNGWSGSGHDIFFLYDPVKKIGDNKTWLLTVQDGGGFWRTTNSGASWTKVWNGGMTHGGSSIYYSKTGMLYAAAGTDFVRSSDNGITWNVITQGLPGGYRMGVGGDGEHLYMAPFGYSPFSFYTSLETDGLTWKQYNNQQLPNGLVNLSFDPVNRIMYAALNANGSDGIWAMQIPGTTDTEMQSPKAAASLRSKRNMITSAGSGLSILNTKGKFFDVKGRQICSSHSLSSVDVRGIPASR
jgi:hypothetical protein